MKLVCVQKLKKEYVQVIFKKRMWDQDQITSFYPEIRGQQ